MYSPQLNCILSSTPFAIGQLRRRLRVKQGDEYTKGDLQ